MKTKEVNKTLVEFWNQAISLTDEDKIAIKKEIPNINDLAPSKKLYDEVVKLGKLDKVLDYGCGSGWASIIASMSGTKEVVAVDMGEAIIDALKFYSELYNLNNIKALTIDEKWLDTINDNTFDGVVCSNVLDVLPLETMSLSLSIFLVLKSKSSTLVSSDITLFPTCMLFVILCPSASVAVISYSPIGRFSKLHDIGIFAIFATVCVKSVFTFLMVIATGTLSIFSTETVTSNSNVHGLNVCDAEIFGTFSNNDLVPHVEKNCLLNSSNAVAPSFKPK